MDQQYRDCLIRIDQLRDGSYPVELSCDGGSVNDLLQLPWSTDEMARVRQQLDDACRLAVGAHAQNDALVGPIHHCGLYQESWAVRLKRRLASN